MMRVALLVLLLAGCASRPPVPEAKLRVPVPCPAPPVIARPALPIANLKPGDPPNVVITAYAATVKALKGYGIQLEKLLDGYRAEHSEAQREQIVRETEALTDDIKRKAAKESGQ